MARSSHPPSEPARLGRQPPRYRFFLNPYRDARFTTCPQCRGETRVRKLPLVIHVDPIQLIALNKTCRDCPRCDLLIAHQDEIEAFLTAFFGQNRPEIVGNDYLVVGMEDRPDWLRGMRTSLSTKEMLNCLHDFIAVESFEPAPRWGWGPT